MAPISTRPYGLAIESSCAARKSGFVPLRGRRNAMPTGRPVCSVPYRALVPELVPVPAQVPLPAADGLLLAGLVGFDARAADGVFPWLKEAGVFRGAQLRFVSAPMSQ